MTNFICEEKNFKNDSVKNWQPMEISENWCNVFSPFGEGNESGSGILNSLKV